LENIYNHHIYWMEFPSSLPSLHPADNYSQIIVAFGAEGKKGPLVLPPPYGRFSYANASWACGFHLIDLWGVPATANTTFIIEYTVNYTRANSTSNNLPVTYSIIGIKWDQENPEYPVPGDGGLGSVHVRSESFTWSYPNSTLVLALGHIHIGSVNISLIDVSKNKTIMSSKPTYDENNFVVSITRAAPDYPMIQGHEYKVVSVYDNSRPYGGVMGLIQIFFHMHNKNNSTVPFERTLKEKTGKGHMQNHFGYPIPQL